MLSLRKAWREAKENPGEGGEWLAHEFGTDASPYATHREIQTWVSPHNFGLGIVREVDPRRPECRPYVGPVSVWPARRRADVWVWKRDLFWQLQIGPIQVVYTKMTYDPMLSVEIAAWLA